MRDREPPPADFLKAGDGGPATLYQGNDARRIHKSPAGGQEYGVFLSPSRRYASLYGPNVHRTHVRIRRPKVVADKSEISPGNLTKADIDKLEARGYDSIVVTHKYSGSRNEIRLPDGRTVQAIEVIVFEPDALIEYGDTDELRRVRDARYNPRWGRQAAGVLFITAAPAPKVLLGLRSAEVYEPHTWGVIGGRVDPGEDAFEAALREAVEELGDVPVDGLLVGKYIYREPAFQYTTFLVQVPEWEIDLDGLNWENDDAEWFVLGDLDPGDADLHFGVQDMLSNWHEIKLLEG